jgi:hypothetical protein
MSDLRNQGPWFNQYHKEYPKWSNLYKERFGGKKKLYKFDMDELADLLRISFPLYHNCAIEGETIKASKLLAFISESYDNEIGGLRLKDIKDIIKSNYKKNDIIDVEQAFNIFKLLLQKHWDLDPNQSDVCTRQILSVFGSRVGYTFESLSKPGIQVSDEFNSESSGSDDDDDDACSCRSDEECSICADDDVCSCKSDEECSICGEDCGCRSDEECSKCGGDTSGDDESDSEASDDSGTGEDDRCSCKTDEDCSLCGDSEDDSGSDSGEEEEKKS